MSQNNISMASGKIGKIVAIRLGPGSDVLASLYEAAEKEGIKSGIILSGAASLRKVILRNPRGYPKTFPITDDVRIYTPLEGPLELSGIAGNIGTKENGELFVHAHVTVTTGCPESIAYGGHLVEGAIIYSTGEFIIGEVEGVEIKRVVDAETHAYEFTPVQK